MLSEVAKQLHELREIRIESKGIGYGTLVGVVAICRDLHAVSNSLV